MVNGVLLSFFHYPLSIQIIIKNGCFFKCLFFFSGESSIDKEYIQIGDSTYDYHVYFKVKIFDLFGDYTEVQSEEFVVNLFFIF